MTDIVLYGKREAYHRTSMERCNGIVMDLVIGIWLCVWVPLFHCRETDYYTSQHGLHKLASVEHEIALGLTNYITSLERRLDIAKRILRDYESSGAHYNVSVISQTVALKNEGNEVQTRNSLAARVTAHPLRAYRLLRRFGKDLPALEKELRLDDERKFLKVTEKVKSRVPFPTQQDIKGAMQGILRAHDTYNMNIDDFTSGMFYGLATNASMNAADCYVIGEYSLEATIFTRAIEWLERAYKLVTTENDTSLPRKDAILKLENAVLQHNRAVAQRSQNPYLFTKPVNLDEVMGLVGGQERKRMLDTDHHVLYNTEQSFTDLTNFAALCSGKQLRSSDELRRLKCWYEARQPVNLLNPLKIESHSTQPLVLQLYDLLSPTLIAKIVDSASTTMSRSEVHSKSQPNSKAISSSRTSTSTWLRDDDKSSFKEVVRVYERLEAFTGLKIVDKGFSEELQVSCYGIAGHFNPHLDTIFSSVDKKSLDKKEVSKGDRYATAMFYLSDVIRGGATAFSRIGVTAEPVQGSAIFWYNMNSDGKPNQLSLHGGCPILFGNKCVANKWIRFNSQTSRLSHHVNQSS